MIFFLCGLDFKSFCQSHSAIHIIHYRDYPEKCGGVEIDAVEKKRCEMRTNEMKKTKREKHFSLFFSLFLFLSFSLSPPIPFSEGSGNVLEMCNDVRI